MKRYFEIHTTRRKIYAVSRNSVDDRVVRLVRPEEAMVVVDVSGVLGIASTFYNFRS